MFTQGVFVTNVSEQNRQRLFKCKLSEYANIDKHVFMSTAVRQSQALSSRGKIAIFFNLLRTNTSVKRPHSFSNHFLYITLLIAKDRFDS